MSALDVVTEALERHGSNRRGSDWVCPTHPDKDPSLSVTEGESGVVMHCHAGCEVETIVKTLGLKMADLFNQPISIRRKEVAAYAYTDEGGSLLYEVVRFEPKDFRQRTPDGAGDWIYRLNGVRRVLYRLPDVIAAVSQGETIYVVEGEKDADAFFSRGLVATCNSGGAGKWRPNHAEALRGARVVVVADRDDAGRKHALEVTDSLENVAASVSVVEPVSGKDSSDHFAAGYDVGDLIGISAASLEEKKPELPEVTPEKRNPLWASVRSLDYIKALPPPTYLVDKLLVSDSLFLIYGLPASMKTFFALDLALCMAYGVPEWFGRGVMSGPVLYVVTEGLAGIGKRVLAWEKARAPETPEASIQFIDRAVNLLDPASVEGLLEVADELQPILTIFDTLARSIPGADENAPGPMSQAISVMDEVRSATRGGVGALHHTPKDGSTPRGHSSLLGAVQTSIKLENNEGEISLTVDKQKDDEAIAMRLRPSRVADSLVLRPMALSEDSSDGIERELKTAKAIAELAVPGTGVAFGLLLEATGMHRATLARAVRGLHTRGRILNLGTERMPRWALTE